VRKKLLLFDVESSGLGGLPTVANMVDAMFGAILDPQNSRNGMVSSRV
jgi:hypothetical protein